MVWWIRALAAITEDLGSIPGTHMASYHSSITLAPEEFDASSDLLSIAQHRGTYTCTDNTLIHVK